MWAYRHQNRQNWYFFWYIFAQKGYIPFSDFYKIWHAGGSPKSLSKCPEFITLSASVIWPNVMKLVRWQYEESSILQWCGKWKSDQECILRTGLPPKVNPFFWLVGTIIAPVSDCLIVFAVILRTEWQWQTNWFDCITSALAAVTNTNWTCHYGRRFRGRGERGDTSPNNWSGGRQWDCPPQSLWYL